jgi:hypothetical protein
MKIEVLYLDDCPNHRPTIEQIKRLVEQKKLRAEISEVKVETTSGGTAFHGSPTVLIDGVDIEPPGSARDIGVTCRLYNDDGRASGVPPPGVLEDAIMQAASREEYLSGHGAFAAPLAAVLSALAAGSCCLPLGYLTAAVGFLGLGRVFRAAQPFLWALSIAALAFGFYRLYVRKSCIVERRITSVLWLWAAAAIVLTMLLFPQQIAAFLAGPVGALK